MKLIAKNVNIKISNKDTKIDIYVNEKGNLVFKGIGSVYYDLLEEELELYQTNTEGDDLCG